MTTVNITAIRNALRDMFGARKYRITADGTIHVHGTMPNTNIDGWYEFGGVGDRDTLYQLGLVNL